jgi:solute carrier family 35, member F5
MGVSVQEAPSVVSGGAGSSPLPAGRAQYLLGLLFILAVALLWSGSSVLVQFIYSDLTFSSPFFVTYLSNVLFALYLPGWGLGTALGAVHNPPLRREGESLRGLLCSSACLRPFFSSVPAAVASDGYAPLARDGRTAEDDVQDVLAELHPSDDQRPGGGALGLGLDGADGSEKEVLRGSWDEQAAAPAAAGKYSHARTLRIGLIMCPLWFAANFSYNTSLKLTSVTSSTIISTTSTLWTFLFATCTGAEQFSVRAIPRSLCF